MSNQGHWSLEEFTLAQPLKGRKLKVSDHDSNIKNPEIGWIEKNKTETIAEEFVWQPWEIDHAVLVLFGTSSASLEGHGGYLTIHNDTDCIFAWWFQEPCCHCKTARHIIINREDPHRERSPQREFWPLLTNKLGTQHSRLLQFSYID